MMKQSARQQEEKKQVRKRHGYCEKAASSYRGYIYTSTRSPWDSGQLTKYTPVLNMQTPNLLAENVELECELQEQGHCMPEVL